MTRRVRATALALAMGATPAAAQMSVDVDEAVQRALAVQPSMVEAEGGVRVAGANERAALGAFLPSLSAFGGTSSSRYDNSDWTPQSYSAGFSTNLPIFEGFARIGSKRAAAATADAADAGLRDEHFQVILATKQIFYAAAASDELVRVASAQVARAEEQLKSANENLRAGSATTSDSLRAMVELGTAQMALLRAEAANAAAQAALARQIGMSGLVRAVSGQALPSLPDTTTVRALAMAESPAILQSEASARAAHARVTVARSRYWPSLGVGYNDRYGGTGSPFSNRDDYARSQGWSASLNWTLFDGFDREAAQVVAAVNRDVADARASDARREVDAEVIRQVALLGAAYRQIDIARVNVQAATEDFRVLSERYRLGVATSLDLTTSQENLTGAEVDLIQAQFDYLVARAQLEALVGREL